MRLYWACTHTTLRNTELPLLIERGIEVVPEEANIGIVLPEDALSYDSDPGIDALWRNRCTIPREYLNSVRRARLLPRQGLVSEPEQSLFNALFDVIYIPSFLDIAVNVKSWFKGEVIFRYFGAFANLQSLEDQCARLDPALVRQLYFLPIFSTLCEAGSASRFDRHSILHPVIDPTDAPLPWRGVRPTQSAVVILYPLFEGGAMVERARALIPLAKKIPITILGRNDPAKVPDDIKQHFALNGSPDRATHFQRMSDARLLIYPYSSSQHMHFVPLEALAAGIPIVCHSNIPLVREFEEAGGSAADIPGVVPSMEALAARAETMFNDAAALPGVAQRQAALPIRFTREYAAAEIDRLIAHLKIGTREEAFPPGTLPPIGRIPTIRGLATVHGFATEAVSVPVVDLIREVALAPLGLSDRGPPFDASLMLSNEEPLRLSIGLFEDERFRAGNRHELAIDALIDGDARLLVTAELWSQGAIVASTRGIDTGKRVGDRWGMTIRFASDVPVALVLTLSVTGEGRARLISASHSLGAPSHSHLELAGEMCGSHDIDRRIRTSAGVPMALLTDRPARAKGLSGTDYPFALEVGAERQLVSLHPWGVTMTAGENLFRLTGTSRSAAVLEVITESWSSSCEESSTRSMALTGQGEFTLDLPIRSPSGPPTSPVFYFRAVEGGPIALLNLALSDPDEAS